MKIQLFYLGMSQKLVEFFSRMSSKTVSVSIDDLRHNDLEIYIKEGYGGKHISYFPPYAFFNLYLNGQKDEAIRQFKSWYRDQFEKYHNVPKLVGGMKFGSLYTLVETKHREEGIILNPMLTNLDINIYEFCLEQRVLQRFELLENIKTNGYRKNNDAIFAIEKDGFFYLKGGHHRCAIMFLLGYKQLPVKVMRK